VISWLFRAGAGTRVVELAGDWVGDVAELLLLLIKVLLGGIRRVLLKPLNGLLDGVENGLLVLLIDLGSETILVVDLVLEGESVVLESVTGLNLLLVGLVLIGILLSLSNHALNVLLGETALVVGNGDGLDLSSTLVGGRDLQDSVGVKLEGDLNLWNTTWGWWNTGKLELAEEVVVLGKSTFTLVDLDQDDGLVVSGGGEDLGLAGWDLGVSWDELSHDTTSGLDTESQWVNVDEKDTGSLSFTRENTTLNSGTVGNSLIWVDTLGSLLAVKELLEKSLDLWNSGRTTNEDNVVNVGLLDLGILENLLDWLEGTLEEINVELLELGSGKSLREVVAIMESLNLDSGRHLGRESTLGLFNLTLQLTHGLEVLGDVHIVLLVVDLGEVLDDTVIEILTTQVSITGSRQDLEDTILNGEKGNIESSSSEIVDDDLTLITLLVKTVGDSGSGWLVNNSENVETGNDTSILGGLTLSIIEVSWNGDDGVGDLVSKVSLGDFLHLAQNHGGDLLWGEGLLLTLDDDLDSWVTILVDNVEWVVLDIVLNILVVELVSNHTPVRGWVSIQLEGLTEFSSG
jgi:hypothetical protein